jgi:drug/metabolite transporter (DMT)-like permease
LPFGLRHLRIYLIIGVLGTVIPNSASYEAIRHLPAGLISILLSMVPIFAFPVALMLGNEKFRARRLAGLMVGLTGVLVIVLPEASLPERAMVAFIPLALVAPFLYAIEGNVVARWGTAGLDPVQVLAGGSLVGAVIALPLALATGEFIDPRAPWGAADLALVTGSMLHALAYAGYVWLVGRAGAVFAVQVSYLVTGFGVTWSMLFLGESYSGWIWAALALMFAGLFLVQPRPRVALAEDVATRQTTV